LKYDFLNASFLEMQGKSIRKKIYNHELYEIIHEPDITFDIRHEGARKAGKFRLRWEDGVTHYNKALGVNNWRNMAINTEDWLKLLKKTRVSAGPPSQ
jgi:hypothetical protein